MKLYQRLFLSSALLGSVVLLPLTPVWAAYAFAQFGSPKYPASFTHFDYVNPAAPKGGVINLSLVSANSRFDKFNPFSLKGQVAPGLLDLSFETLAINSLDEPNTIYGLLADDIQVAADFGSVTFHINPLARFNNGDAVKASDVLYSFTTLTGKKASPRFKSYFAEISGVKVIDNATSRFDFSRKGRDLVFVAASLPVFSPKWGLKADGTRVPFDALRLQKPITTGPYTITTTDTGALDVVYQRNKNYWADDLPVRRGFYNFGKVVYKLYKDRDTQVTAIRAGNYDYISEPQARYWCCQYIGKRFDDGEYIKKSFANLNPPAMNGWVVNTRQEKFKDPRVREALNYLLDFQWINQKILNGEYKRQDSYFARTSMQAKGLPDAAELKLLEPFRAELPPAVFGPAYQQPDSSGPGGFRNNLKKALDLFAAAGWHYSDGWLRNAQGQPFEITLTGARFDQSPHTETVKLNLLKAGVKLNQKLADAATSRRLMNDFDYDYTTLSLRDSRLQVTELWRTFNSQDADVKGSGNIIGVKSPAVDFLLQKMLTAQTRQEEDVAGRALDRVLLQSHYFIPFRYLDHHNIIYNHRLQYPKQLPSYYGPDEWVLGTWWDGSVQATPGKPVQTL